MLRRNPELALYAAALHDAGGDDAPGERAFAPQSIIVAQGAPNRSAYVVKSGIAKCYLANEDGTDFVQEFFGEGELFGELEAFRGGDSFCSVEALTETVVYEIPAPRFLRLLDEDRKFNALVMRALAQKVAYKADRHAFHQSNRLEANVLRLIEQWPALFETVSKRDAASYLGVAERSLNRALQGLKRRGLLDR